MIWGAAVLAAILIGDGLLVLQVRSDERRNLRGAPYPGGRPLYPHQRAGRRSVVGDP